MVKKKPDCLMFSCTLVDAAYGGGLRHPTETGTTTFTVSLLSYKHILQFHKLVFQFPCILVGEIVFLLVIFELFLYILDQFLNLLGVKFFLHLDFVSRFIIDLIRTLLLFDLAINLDLAFLSEIARSSDIVFSHDPLLRAHSVSELFIVADDDNTSLEGFKAAHKSTKAVAIQIIRRLAKNDNVRVLPT